MRVKFISSFVVITLFTGIFCSCEKDKLDRQMAEFCQKDGGSRVYEKIVLPEEMFDESGYPFPGWRNRLNREDRLSKDYLYIHEDKILKPGDPFKGEGQLSRIHIKIIRKSDNKLLGETVAYIRAGGDGFVIGHYTMNSCPKTGEPIEKLVFVKNN